MDNLQKIAVLIDADNTQLSKIEGVLRELSTNGRIVVKKAYGNWKKPSLKNWEVEVRRLAIKAEQQFDYISGKNTTDIAMVIDAMDMLHERSYDAFVIVSSDSDFTPLAIRLRESGAYIIGAGEKKTPEAFRNACDEFLFLEYIDDVANSKERDTLKTDISGDLKSECVSSKDATPVEEVTENGSDSDIDDIHNLLALAYNKFQDAEGFANIASAGHFIKRAKPDFTPLSYGYSKLPELVAAFPGKYEMKRFKGKGTVTIIAYKCIH